jgi:hypothetical protein
MMYSVMMIGMKEGEIITQFVSEEYMESDERAVNG